MFDYKKIVKEYEDLKNHNPNIYKNINPVSAARMRLQNRFHTGLDIANTLLTSCMLTWLTMIKTPVFTLSL